VVAVALVALTGWAWLDPAIALAVAANIVWTGVGLVRRSALGLMDSALPPEERAAVRVVLDRYAARGVAHHALRTRQAGAHRFVSFHVLVPGDWSVARGHSLLERMEADLRAALPGATVFTHLEPTEDPSAWDDTALDRPAANDPTEGGSAPPSRGARGAVRPSAGRGGPSVTPPDPRIGEAPDAGAPSRPRDEEEAPCPPR
jgi:hypothetical protein